MNVKYLLASALLGGLVMFIWGAVYHAAIGIDERTMSEFRDSRAVAEFVRDHTSGNGMYYSKEGVLAAVNLTPDLADRSQNMTPQLINQIIIEIVTAALLAWLLTFTNMRSALGAAGVFALAALAAGICMNMSAWNWYGHSLPYTLGAIFGLVAGWFLGGVVIGWLRRKFAPAT